MQRPAASVMSGATTTFAHQMTAHAGPLPAPETLSGYEEILPGAAERILRMAEREQESRLTLESRQLESDIQHRDDMANIQRRVHTGAFASDYIGQVLGFALAAAALGLAAYAGIWRENWAVSALFLSLPVVGMIQAVRGMKQKAKEDN